MPLDEFEQGGLADPVTADEPDLGAHRQGDGGLVEKAASPRIEDEIFDLQH